MYIHSAYVYFKYKKPEALGKPNSVEDGHLSTRPTRESNEAGSLSSFIWSRSGRGLPCHFRHRKCGELLPRHFTLTPLLE